MTPEEIDRRFRFWPALTDEKRNAHGAVRTQLGDVAKRLVADLPDCRETALAVTKLEEAMFWANAALARGE